MDCNAHDLAQTTCI